MFGFKFLFITHFLGVELLKNYHTSKWVCGKQWEGLHLVCKIISTLYCWILLYRSFLFQGKAQVCLNINETTKIVILDNYRIIILFWGKWHHNFGILTYYNFQNSKNKVDIHFILSISHFTRHRDQTGRKLKHAFFLPRLKSCSNSVVIASHVNCIHRKCRQS